ncbi:tetraacyldisaccharide 4'-kinase [Fretibacterium sp. OH1220_COT-178]|uniref:tetraacyldisaccharide 4'-kinase n=1 Tax=Fretibacterium sp. OH1220_COT-178 TaxID=2491047 RepID=UPI000F5EBC37|nr:tetraacyldisaccharide 4'-kinase [Fretibacterium sp. OH1220_COT-178]RRD63816.1 tetraacyldisaccharide 4'-kinase [Fretibacterium sp. OH1220_COT-178]
MTRLGGAIVRNYMAHVRGERFSPLWALLTPASWLNRLIVGSWGFLHRHGLKRSDEPPLPLISVGNLTYGGTNKTPFVEMLARTMRDRGVRVGIVSRGYGGGRSRSGSVLVVEGGDGDRAAAGDEPLLLSERLADVPVAIARRRIEGVRELRRRGVELTIADDAFQHRRLGRDVDVVLIDAACPFGNGTLIPSGILREPPSALARAHVVVLTKVDQAGPEALSALRTAVERHVPAERIFTSRLRIDGWGEWDGALRPCDPPAPGSPVLAFSAIGNPESFARSLRDEGLRIVGEHRFKDHHRYRPHDLEALLAEGTGAGASFLACTEKDLYNLPASWRPPLPLRVPRVASVLDEPERFFALLTEALRPRLVVASNGYGEDAIGVLLAERLRTRFPASEVLAFPLVGRGDAYRASGFPVRSAPSVTPSGGVVKYRLRDLWGDMRAGLLRHVRDQLRAWAALRDSVRTPLCVGDVYLLLHTLWGCGVRPLFVATAKTVHLSGHWRLERALIRRFVLRTWTRDPESAEQLQRSGADAVYAGSPIMDLLGDAPPAPPPGPPGPGDVPLVLLLPGSRLRAYEDVRLLLDAAGRLNGARPCRFRMVLAPTLSASRLIASCAGWTPEGPEEKPRALRRGTLRLDLTTEPVSTAARGADLLIGLGGTANQLCAGLGIPVVSIDEKGKRVQKKLLGDAEILVEATPEALAECALRVLADPGLYERMSSAGRARMGAPGALADMADHAASALGWDARERLYTRLRDGL